MVIQCFVAFLQKIVFVICFRCFYAEIQTKVKSTTHGNDVSGVLDFLPDEEERKST